MKSANVYAIVCSRPDSIYYLTNYYPQLAKMGTENIIYAIFTTRYYSGIYSSRRSI